MPDAGSVKEAAREAARKAAVVADNVGSTLGKTAAAVTEPLGITHICCVGLCPRNSSITCVVCRRHFCKEHQQNGHTMQSGIIREAGQKYCVPIDLKKQRDKSVGLGSSVTNLAAGAAKSINSTFTRSKEFVCCWPTAENAPLDGLTCKDRCVKRFLDQFEEERAKDMRVDELRIFLNAGEEGEQESMKQLFAFKKPSSKDTTADDRYMMAAYKGVDLALQVAPLPIVLIGKMGLYGLQANFLIRMLKESFGVDNSVMELMFALKKPLMHGLRNMSQYCSPEVAKSLLALTYKDIARDIVPSIFYLSRKHIFDLRSGKELTLDSSMDAGTPCSPELLERLRPCLGPADWLYRIKLPGVHSTPEWTKWYMGQVLKVDGWNLIGASVQTQMVPKMEHELEADEERPEKTVYVDKNWTIPAFCLAIREEVQEKEAVLVVRGTSSALDWTINLNGLPQAMCYHQGPEGNDGTTEGNVHGGFYRGALGILEHCHMYEALEALLEKGYNARLIGHSLGAGTVTIMAMLLKQRFVEQVRAGTRQTVPYVPVVGFGVPPCVDPVIADALAEDGLVLSAVHAYDIVPRLSEANVLPLAEEVFLYKAQAEAQLSEDLKAFKSYAKSMGKASRIGDQPLQGEAMGGSAVVNGGGEDDPNSLPSAVPSSPPPVASEDELVEAVPELDAPSDKKHSEREILELLVVPGKIVFIAKGKDSRMRAIMSDHREDTLKSIKLVDSCTNDHSMRAYADAFRDVTLGTRHLFPSTVRNLPQLQNPVLNGKFVPCGVCNEDVVWPYLTKSIACRASATKNCAICGKIVCNVCAPAGEKIPGDGYGAEHTLADLQQTLPTMGLYQPQRVCLPCYFSHHEY